MILLQCSLELVTPQLKALQWLPGSLKIQSPHPGEYGPFFLSDIIPSPPHPAPSLCCMGPPSVPQIPQSLCTDHCQSGGSCTDLFMPGSFSWAPLRDLPGPTFPRWYTSHPPLISCFISSYNRNSFIICYSYLVPCLSPPWEHGQWVNRCLLYFFTPSGYDMPWYTNDAQ